MSFYNTANFLIEALDAEEITGKELIQSYVISLFDMEREAIIVYDFLEQEGFLDEGVFMTSSGNLMGGKPDGTTNYYIMFPRSVVVGNQVLKDFFNKYKILARDNNFHFLLRNAEDMLINGKELLNSVYPIRKWRPMKKKTREHFGDILSGLNEEITTGDIESSARAHERLKRGVVPDHVIIFLTYKQRSGRQNEYIFKPIKKLSRQEKEIYKTLVTKYKVDSSHTDRFGVSVFMATSDEINFIRDLDYISMYKGDKRDLEEFLHEYLKINNSDNYVEKKPIMGKKAQSHFGDIIDNL